MKLDEIMNEINEKGTYTGNLSFEMLALSSYSTNKKKLIFIDDINYITDKVIESNNNVILTTNEIASKGLFSSFCICDHPRIIFFKIHNFLSNKEEYIRKEFVTKIGDESSISQHSIIAENNVIIGNHVVIEEFCVIRENTVIGDNSIIRAGSKIGGQGFEFKRIEEGIMPVTHVGGVNIGNNVEIKCNSIVDKAVYPWDNTEINDFSKIDSFVFIAHAVKIGKNVMIAGKTNVGGRSIIGDNAWISSGTNIINGITIGNNAFVHIGAIVTKPIPENGSTLPQKNRNTNEQRK